MHVSGKHVWHKKLIKAEVVNDFNHSDQAVIPQPMVVQEMNMESSILKTRKSSVVAIPTPITQVKQMMMYYDKFGNISRSFRFEGTIVPAPLCAYLKVTLLCSFVHTLIVMTPFNFACADTHKV